MQLRVRSHRHRGHGEKNKTRPVRHAESGARMWCMGKILGALEAWRRAAMQHSGTRPRLASAQHELPWTFMAPGGSHPGASCTIGGDACRASRTRVADSLPRARRAWLGSRWSERTAASRAPRRRRHAGAASPQLSTAMHLLVRAGKERPRQNRAAPRQTWATHRITEEAINAHRDKRDRSAREGRIPCRARQAR